MAETYLCQIAETSDFMMSFVFLTEKGNAVVVDGGRPEDIPSLREIVGDRPVKAWILTHPHFDHISGFTDVMQKGEGSLRFEKLYYSFPSMEAVEEYEPDEAWTLREFLAQEDKFRSRAVQPHDGDVFRVDELEFTVLQACEESELIRKHSFANENSLVFRVRTPKSTILFLGDIGPVGGDRLYERHWQDLKCDFVQMAHHGHSGPGAEVYIAAAPRACMWCCRDWLYDEAPGIAPGVEEKETRFYGTRTTRMWMDALGVKTHYVTMNGTQYISV